MIQDEIVYTKNAGRMSKCLILVENHVTDIPKRLQEEVNPSYIVMFNPKTQKFEVHRRGRNDCSLELNLPFDELDSRAIEYALNARDISKIRKGIEEHNAKLDEERKKEIAHVQSCKTRDLFTYCNRHMDKETFDKDSYKTRFV